MPDISQCESSNDLNSEEIMDKEKEETLEKDSEPHRVWIGEADRIASFHEVDTYNLQSFRSHETFLKFLRSLQERGFRFQ